MLQLQNFKMPVLNETDQALLASCMDEIRNVVGDNISERQLVETIMQHKFDCAKSLDAILNNNTSSETASTSVSSQIPMETGKHAKYIRNETIPCAVTVKL